jgi:EmrB/QacA subfamily drug resistance transporter
MNDVPVNTAYRYGRRRTLVVVSGLLLGILLAALNQTIVATALPHIVSDLGGLDHYSWVFSAYMLGSTITVPLYGKLSDIYGRRPFFVLAIVLFMAGAVVSGTAVSMGQLIAGRAVQGLGAGGLVPLSMAVIGDLVAPRERGKWQGVTGAVIGVASIIGPATGGWISDNASWRWAFFVSLPFGLLALAVVFVGFRIEPEHRDHSVDYIGAALLTAGVSAGLLATVWGGSQYPWLSLQVMGLYVGAAILLGAFVRHERRAPDPILPLELFRNRTFAAAQAALFMVGAAMFATIMFTPLFVQGVLGRSATNSGAVLTPLILGLIGASIIAGQVTSRTGRYKGLLLASPLVLGAGLLLMTRLGAGSTSGEMTRDMIVVGIGIGLGMQTFVLVVQNAVPQSVMGVATAATQFSRLIGATIGVTVMGAVLTGRLNTELAARLTSAQQHRLGGGGSLGSLVQGSAGHLPAAIATQLHEALAAAMHSVFVLCVPLAVLALVATLFVEQRQLRRTMAEEPRAAEPPAPSPRAPVMAAESH